MKYLSVKDYHRFQHYRDRSPPWIKLYNTLLNDWTFLQMSESAQINLVKLWLLASRHDNAIPFDLAYITGQLLPKSALDIDELIINGFVGFVENPGEAKKAKPRPKKRKRKTLRDSSSASSSDSKTVAKVEQNARLEETEERESREEADIKDIPAKRGGWPAEAAALWDEKVAPISPGQCGAILKQSVLKFGWPATKAGIEKFILGTPEWKTPRLDIFAKEANKWVRFGGMATTDEKGDFTEWGLYFNEITRKKSA